MNTISSTPYAPRPASLAPSASGWRRWLSALRQGIGRTAPSADDPTAEANRVREMAMQYMRHDPGFAADLMAAADRHEEKFGR